MSNRKYRVIKDLPGIKTGSEFIFNEDTGKYHLDGRTHWFSYYPNIIKGSPEWFEEVKGPEAPARIEVRQLWFECHSSKGGMEYCMELSQPIPEGKWDAVKIAIEAVVNGGTMWGCYQEMCSKLDELAGENFLLKKQYSELAYLSRNHPFGFWTDELVKEYVGTSLADTIMDMEHFKEQKMKSVEQSKPGQVDSMYEKMKPRRSQYPESPAGIKMYYEDLANWNHLKSFFKQK